MLRKLIEKWSCLHQWAQIKEISYYYPNTKRPYKQKQCLLCEKCGKIKTIKF